MSKQKMLAARELINEKRYAEARTLLKTIDDPKAKEWLKKLDQIAPEKKKSGGKLVLVAVALIVLVVIGIVVVIIVQKNNAKPTNQGAVVVIPTQAELPSEMPTLTPSPTFTHTDTPAPTNTALPTVTNTPSSTPTPECLVTVWWQQAEEYLLDFLSYTDIAMNTARISVGDVLVNMQRSKRDFERLATDPCYLDTRNSINEGMNYVMEAFGDFQSDMSLTVLLNMVAAISSFEDGLRRLQQIGVPIYSDTEEIVDDLSRNWSFGVGIRIGEMLSGCLSNDYSRWSDNVKDILQSLSGNLDDIFTLNSNVIRETFIQIMGLDYPSCVENARQSLLLGMDHLYQALNTVYTDSYSAAEHIIGYESEFQRYLDELQRVTPTQRSST